MGGDDSSKPFLQEPDSTDSAERPPALPVAPTLSIEQALPLEWMAALEGSPAETPTCDDPRSPDSADEILDPADPRRLRQAESSPREEAPNAWSAPGDVDEGCHDWPTKWETKQHSMFHFKRYEPIWPHPGWKKAEQLLREIAHDPGIIWLMKVNNWSCDALCEMDPNSEEVKAFQEQEADDYDGIDDEEEDGPHHLLGLNCNFGEKIFLQLRTDDGGWRSYQGIIMTLCHELAHNKYTAHNQRFWNFCRDLRREYWTIHKRNRFDKWPKAQWYWGDDEKTYYYQWCWEKRGYVWHWAKPWKEGETDGDAAENSADKPEVDQPEGLDQPVALSEDDIIKRTSVSTNSSGACGSADPALLFPQLPPPQIPPPTLSDVDTPSSRNADALLKPAVLDTTFQEMTVGVNEMRLADGVSTLVGELTKDGVQVVFDLATKLLARDTKASFVDLSQSPYREVFADTTPEQMKLLLRAIGYSEDEQGRFTIDETKMDLARVVIARDLAEQRVKGDAFPVPSDA